jgi:hypothetical protein
LVKKRPIAAPAGPGGSKLQPQNPSPSVSYNLGEGFGSKIAPSKSSNKDKSK